MWFKQATLFQFSRPLKMDQNELAEALAPLTFSPCLPSLPTSVGWVSPLDVADGPLVYGNHRYWMVCMQFEEKILPAAVIKQALQEKVEKIEQDEARKIRSKEKLSLKDDIIQTLLPKAFTKKTRVYGYLDLEHQWLIINTITPAKIERFLSFLKRAITTVEFKSPDIKKPAHVMTQWIKESAPDDFGIGQSGVLQDPQQQRRVIRCQHQDLLANAIQSLLKDGCEITQLGLHWKEQLQFVLTSEFALRSIQFQEAVLALSKSDYTETPQQRFDADFVIMTEILTQLADDLLAAFSKNAVAVETV